ncbi:hypothetical protein JMJ35_007949 [Cladonia borealis]|uniref:Uncharacterized protein n=1 Tax=Cladonia borealis TaxID=184061 RepID=A0AA39QWV1_9LECA|nr:hypothetical protein JMJ35_007949 [Cladonia borealis]
MAPGHTRDSSKASSGLSELFSEFSFDSKRTSEAPSEDEQISPKSSKVPLETVSKRAQDSVLTPKVNSEPVEVSDISPAPSSPDKPKEKHVHGPECRHAPPFQDFPTWGCVHADTSRHPSHPPKPPPEAVPTHEFSFELSDTSGSDDRTDPSAIVPAKDIQRFDRPTTTGSALEDDSDPVQRSSSSD